MAVKAQDAVLEKLKTQYAKVEFLEGMYRVSNGNQKGMCDADGKLIVPVNFSYVYTSHSSKYISAKKYKGVVVYDKKGNLILDLPYDDISAYQLDDGYAAVQKDGKEGAVNLKGELIIPIEYDDVSAYQLGYRDNNYCKVKNGNKYGVVSRKGELVVPCQFDNVPNSFNDVDKTGCCIVMTGGKKGLFDIAKQSVSIPCQYDDIYFFDYSGNKEYFYTFKNNRIGVIDKNKEIIPCIYPYLSFKTNYWIACEGGTRPNDILLKSLNATLACKPKDAKWGVLNLDGKVVIPLVYDNISDIFGDIVVVHKGGTMEFEQSTSYMEDNVKKYFYFSKHVGGKIGFYNIKNNKKTDCIFDGRAIGGGYIGCSRSGKWGFLDAETMKEAVPFQYEKAMAFKDGVAQVVQGGVSTFITDPKRGTTMQLANGDDSSIKIDQNIPSGNTTQEESFAFIFANENYIHLKGADFAINDGKVFREYCEKTFGIPTKNIRYFEDATYGNLNSAIQKIKDIADVYEGDAKFIIYFSGLGATNASTKECYILPTDASIETLEVTGFSVSKLMEELNTLNVRQTVVILDAPFSGLDKNGKQLAQNRGVTIKAKDPNIQGNTVLCMTSGNEEAAYSSRNYGHSLFTYALLDLVQDTKGKCTLQEALDHATKWVKKESLKQFNKVQSPKVTTSAKLEGKLQSVKF